MFMKSRVYVLLLVCLPFISFSQAFNGGLIGGLAASQVEGDQMGGYNQIGVVAGAFLELPTGNNFAFQPELRFCQKGSSGYYVQAYANAHLNYVELPLLMNWTYKRAKLEAGLVPAVLVNAFVNNNQGVSDIKTFDMGFAAGISYMATDKVRFNIRYTHTLPLMYRYENNCITLALFYYLKNDNKQE